jgi:hypothetical protein
MGTRAQRLLRWVASRHGIASVGSGSYVAFCILAGLYAGLLLCSRLLGLIPNLFAPLNLLTIAAASLALGVAFRRRLPLSGAARLVDGREGTDDLFLTAVLIGGAAGGYGPLVLRAAEQRAGTVSARRVVPLRWWPMARNVGAVSVLLLAGVFLLPQFDPFGREGQRRRVEEQRRQLDDARRATAMRAALLKEQAQGELSKAVAQAMQDLKLAFNSMKPADKQGNLRRLSETQGKVSELWRQGSENRLKDAFPPGAESQRFGQGKTQKADEWRQELAQGQTAGLSKEVAELKEAVQQLARASDPVEKKKLAQQLKQRLGQMKDCVGGALNSSPVSAALKRAMDQLAMTGMEGMSQQALEGLQESLDLTELELESLQQSLQDLQVLEEGLKALQLARLANESTPLDGGACSACQAMADYAALYAKLTAGRCSKCGGALLANSVCSVCGARGIGRGMVGPGTGVGGLAPEDESTETAFQPEKSRSALSAGKVLLSIKTQGLSDPGQAVVDYREQLTAVRDGVSEAILHEQVPPSYHDAIQKYFDSLVKPDAGTE